MDVYKKWANHCRWMHYALTDIQVCSNRTDWHRGLSPVKKLMSDFNFYFQLFVLWYKKDDDCCIMRLCKRQITAAEWCFNKYKLFNDYHVTGIISQMPSVSCGQCSSRSSLASTQSDVRATLSSDKSIKTYCKDKQTV